MQLQYDIQGLGPVLKALRKTKGAVRNMTAFLKVAGGFIVESVNRNFMAGGRPKWAELTEATKRRRKQGPGEGSPQILRDNGFLMNSIGVPSKKGYYELRPLEVAVGTNVPYAKYHQFSTKNMPARPFMMLQKADEEKIMKAAIEHIDKGNK